MENTNPIEVEVIAHGRNDHGRWLDFEYLGELHRCYEKLRKVSSGPGEVRTFTEFHLVYDIHPEDVFAQLGEDKGL